VTGSSFPFRVVLVANRGEIAVRVIRTLQKLGLQSAVVYHEVDARSPAVALADHAIKISGKTPVSSYLDGDQIIAAALSVSAGAIHPGYGFLSENAVFARAVEAAGLIFIGPSADVIELMGDKIRARNFVARSGFPVAPSAIEEDDPATFLDRARAVGAPLVVKPSAGGGGKGMRIVRDLAELDDAVVQARGEGQRYFGDGRLYAERFVERPRHIEVQVLGDSFGNVVHLFERECSVQRRFQKIIEETPSPALSADVRKRICETAAGIARAAGYRNAGTVEFIYGRGEFYFLEMNTRLQVEHPVTEMTTGLDLVAEQVVVAAGHPLAFGQDDVRSNGHAIEARLYAEAPKRNFAPTTGKVLL
jgi:acetyl-CoA/propionyl-CoA carboxylase biotin carboxyl carrier protein